MSSDPRKPDLAETIVRRIVENTVRVSCARWSIVESLDEDADMTEEDLVEDALGVALGEDTGCLGDDEMDAEHIDVLFVRSAISRLEAQLLTMTDNYNMLLDDAVERRKDLDTLQAQLRQAQSALAQQNTMLIKATDELLVANEGIQRMLDLEAMQERDTAIIDAQAKTILFLRSHLPTNTDILDNNLHRQAVMHFMTALYDGEVSVDESDVDTFDKKKSANPIWGYGVAQREARLLAEAQLRQEREALEIKTGAATFFKKAYEQCSEERAQLQTTVGQLRETLRKARQLGSIGYRIGEADMRGYDRTGERYGKKQEEIEREIDAALAICPAPAKEQK